MSFHVPVPRTNAVFAPGTGGGPELPPPSSKHVRYVGSAWKLSPASVTCVKKPFTMPRRYFACPPKLSRTPSRSGSSVPPPDTQHVGASRAEAAPPTSLSPGVTQLTTASTHTTPTAAITRPIHTSPDIGT